MTKKRPTDLYNHTTFRSAQKQRLAAVRTLRVVRKIEPTRPPAGVCECCKNIPKKKALHLDHDHVTGKFRGWLCFKCNVGIGMLGDNRHGINLAAKYLLMAQRFKSDDNF